MFFLKAVLRKQGSFFLFKKGYKKVGLYLF